MSGIGGKRRIVKALKRVRMGKTGGDVAGLERGRCFLGSRECFGLGAVFEELLAFGFVVTGDGWEKQRERGEYVA